MAFWGDRTYNDGSPVPMTGYRCKTPLGDGKHSCKFHIGHNDDCKCLCGVK